MIDEQCTEVVEFETFGIVNKLSDCDVNLSNAGLVAGEVSCDNVPIKSARVEVDGITSITGTYGKYMVFPIFSLGQQTVKAGKAGYQKYSTTLNVTGGARFTLNIPLAKKTGSEIVSISDAGAQGNYDSVHSSANYDGRFVVFESQSTTLSQSNTGGFKNVFCRDRDMDQTIQISKPSASGLPYDTAPDGSSRNAAISGNGDYIAFESTATNLASSGVSTSNSQIFLYDRPFGIMRVMSACLDGTRGNGSSVKPSISYSGNFIAFESEASNLVSGVSGHQVYVRNVNTGDIYLASGLKSGDTLTAGDANSFNASISGDGRYTVFSSYSTNLASDMTENTKANIYIFDLNTGETSLISSGIGGAISDGDSLHASVSYDGSYIAFESEATNLVNGFNNSKSHIYFWSKNSGLSAVTKNTNSESANGYSRNPSISSNGRYVSFDSDATDIIDGFGSGQRNVYLADMATGEFFAGSVYGTGTATPGTADSQGPSLSGDAQVLSYESAASNLTDNDANGCKDVFLHYMNLPDTNWPEVITNPTATPTSSPSPTPSELPQNLPTIIQGTITYGGAPVANEYINIGNYCFVTDSNGFYASDDLCITEPAAMTVSVDDSLYSYTDNNVQFTNGTTNVYNVALNLKPASLYGYIYDEKYYSVKNASVTLNGVTIQSDSNGYYNFQTINLTQAYQTLEISVIASGHPDYVGSVTIVAGSSNNFNITLKNPPPPVTTISGKVTIRGTDTPIEGAYINMYINDAGSIGGLSGPDGTYTISYQSNYTGSVYAYCNKYGFNYNGGSINVVSGTVNTLNIEMDPLSSQISGTVTCENQPVSGITVEFGSYSAVTDSKGHYLIESITVDGTSHDLSINDSAYQSFSESINIDPGSFIVRDITLTSLPGAVSGKVTDASNGAGIDNATVTIGGLSTTTSGGGQYTITNLPAGLLAESVTADGYVSYNGSITVHGGPNADNDIQLTPNPPEPTPEASPTPIPESSPAPTIIQGTVTYNGVPQFTQFYIGDKSIHTGDYGFYTSGDLNFTAPVTVRIYVDNERYFFDENVLIENNKTTIYNIELTQKPSSLSGRVLNSAGAIIPNAAITVNGIATSSDEEGYYSVTGMHLAADDLANVSVTATHEGYADFFGSAEMPVGRDSSYDIVMSSLPTPVTTISGRVTTTAGTGISGAFVAFYGSDYCGTTTDNNGYYTMSAQLLSLEGSVEASRSGFVTKSVSVTLTAGSNNTVNIILDELSTTLTGTVTCDGQPVKGIEVVFGENKTVSDDNGCYRFTDIAGSSTPQTLSVTNAAYQPYSKQVTVPPGSFVVEDISLTSIPGSIHGKVTDLKGNAISGATLSVGSKTTSSGADGSYSITELSAGKTVVSANPNNPRYSSYTGSVDIKGGEDIEYNIMLKDNGITVKGTVTGDSGAVAGADVSVNGVHTYSGIDGSYIITDIIGSGAMPVKCVKDGFITYNGSVNAEPGSTVTYNINLQVAFGTVRGTVTVGRGPVMGAKVTIDGITFITDAQGKYFITNLRTAGARSITATHNNYSSYSAYVNVVPGQITVCDFEMTPKSINAKTVVTGIVRDWATEEPIGGAAVTIGAQTVPTDAFGVYRMELTDVSGLTGISAACGGYDPFTGTVEVVAGKTINRDLWLSPTDSGGAGGWGTPHKVPSRGQKNRWSKAVIRVAFNPVDDFGDIYLYKAKILIDGVSYYDFNTQNVDLGTLLNYNRNGNILLALDGEQEHSVSVFVKSKGYTQDSNTVTFNIPKDSTGFFTVKMNMNCIKGKVKSNYGTQPALPITLVHQLNQEWATCNVSGGQDAISIEDGTFLMKKVALPEDAMNYTKMKVNLQFVRPGYKMETIEVMAYSGGTTDIGAVSLAPSILRGKVIDLYPCYQLERTCCYSEKAYEPKGFNEYYAAYFTGSEPAPISGFKVVPMRTYNSASLKKPQFVMYIDYFEKLRYNWDLDKWNPGQDQDYQDNCWDSTVDDFKIPLYKFKWDDYIPTSGADGSFEIVGFPYQACTFWYHTIFPAFDLSMFGRGNGNYLFNITPSAMDRYYNLFTTPGKITECPTVNELIMNMRFTPSVQSKYGLPCNLTRILWELRLTNGDISRMQQGSINPAPYSPEYGVYKSYILKNFSKPF